MLHITQNALHCNLHYNSEGAGNHMKKTLRLIAPAAVAVGTLALAACSSDGGTG